MYTGSEKLFEANLGYELHILSNANVSAAKDHGESYMKVRPPLVRHLLRNCLLGSVVEFDNYVEQSLLLNKTIHPHCKTGANRRLRQ